MLFLLNRNEELVHSLQYNNLKRTREINGIHSLEFETTEEIKLGTRIVLKDTLGIWCEYIITDFDVIHNSDGVLYDVYCEDSSTELFNTFIEDLKPRNETAGGALSKVLANTRFEVGSVDDFGNRSFNLYRTNAKSAIWKILERYNAEIRIRTEVKGNEITARYVDLKHRLGYDLGKRFSYKKDIISVKKNTDYSSIVTKLYAFGKGEEIFDESGQSTGGYGRKIDFSEVNNGQKYITDEDARIKYGIGKDRYHIEGSVEFDDCEDKQELLELAKQTLSIRNKPQYTYEINVEDISLYKDTFEIGVGLGDIVIVTDEEIDVAVETRVIKIVDDPTDKTFIKQITLGNYVKSLVDDSVLIEELKASLRNQNDIVADDLLKLNQNIEKSYIDSVIERFNTELNTTGGWVYAEEGEGLLILNAPKDQDPTMAIKLAGGMIAIANQKKPDGTFDYRTFGDGSGFTADLIRAGALRGGRVNWNLEDGTFIIGKNANDFHMFWDGNTLRFRNVDIDLENNKDIKKIREELGDLGDELDDEIQEINQKFKIQDGNLISSITTVREEIRQNGDDVKTYVSNNYSTIIQTDEKIKEELKKVTTYKDSKTGEEKSLLDKQMEIEKSIDGIRIDITNNQVANEQALELNLKEITESMKEKLDEIETSFDETKLDIENTVLAYKQELEAANGRLKSEITAVSKEIEKSENGIKEYLSLNYSNIEQTDRKIKSEVKQVQGDITNAKNTANMAMSTAQQTASQLSTKVSSGEFYSQINQTNQMISRKVGNDEVHSLVQQSMRDIKIRADQIYMEGDAFLEGKFRTNSYGRYIQMEGSSIDFMISSGRTQYDPYTGQYKDMAEKIGSISVGYGSSSISLNGPPTAPGALYIGYERSSYYSYIPMVTTYNMMQGGLYIDNISATSGVYAMNIEADRRLKCHSRIYLGDNLWINRGSGYYGSDDQIILGSDSSSKRFIVDFSKGTASF